MPCAFPPHHCSPPDGGKEGTTHSIDIRKHKHAFSVVNNIMTTMITAEDDDHYVYVYTVCALIFAGFNVRGFRGSAAIREYFVREYLDITVNGPTQLEPINDVMRNKNGDNCLRG